MTISLICPVCQEILQQQEKMWQCSNLHSYDRAKQGYVNLHIVQHKHSKSPGDTAEAVQARRLFLQAGFYEPLQLKIIDIVKQLNISCALDIGCGEGYYTQAMSEVVPRLIAVDISKSAIQLAARQDKAKKVTWVVGTGAVLPVAKYSLQLCTSLFSPLPKAEMLRVLEDNGYLVMATPAAKHLFELRQALFQDVQDHQPEKFIQQLQPEFKLIEQHSVEHTFTLNQEQLQQLIYMTPYAWKAKKENRDQLNQCTEFETTASFCVYVFQKQ